MISNSWLKDFNWIAVHSKGFFESTPYAYHSIAINYTKNKNSPYTLQAVALKVLTSDECEAVYSNYNLTKHKLFHQRFAFLREYEICVEGGGKSTCRGDSGGPLICEGISLEIFIIFTLISSSQLSFKYWFSKGLFQVLTTTDEIQIYRNLKLFNSDRVRMAR